MVRTSPLKNNIKGTVNNFRVSFQTNCALLALDPPPPPLQTNSPWTIDRRCFLLIPEDIVIGSAEVLHILCVRCAWWEREREIQRERERERERESEWDGSDVTLVALNLAMNIAPFLAKTLKLAMNFALFLAKNFHLSFSPLEGRWDHTFRCQKRCALRNSSRSSFCFCQMAWQGIEALKQAIEFPAAPTFFSSKKWIKLIPKTIGNRKRDCAWGCARRINTISENLQIEEHKSVRRWAERTPSWFVLFDLQIFWGGVYPPSATSRTISFSISNSFWY